MGKLLGAGTLEQNDIDYDESEEMKRKKRVFVAETIIVPTHVIQCEFFGIYFSVSTNSKTAWQQIQPYA